MPLSTSAESRLGSRDLSIEPQLLQASNEFPDLYIYKHAAGVGDEEDRLASLQGKIFARDDHDSYDKKHPSIPGRKPLRTPHSVSTKKPSSDKTPHHGDKNHHYDGKDPHHGNKDPHYGDKNPHKGGKDPHHGGKYPHNGGKDPHHDGKDPHHNGKDPHHTGKDPHHGGKDSHHGKSPSHKPPTHKPSKTHHKPGGKPTSKPHSPHKPTDKPDSSSQPAPPVVIAPAATTTVPVVPVAPSPIASPAAADPNDGTDDNNNVTPLGQPKTTGLATGPTDKMSGASSSTLPTILGAVVGTVALGGLVALGVYRRRERRRTVEEYTAGADQPEMDEAPRTAFRHDSFMALVKDAAQGFYAPGTASPVPGAVAGASAGTGLRNVVSSSDLSRQASGRSQNSQRSQLSRRSGTYSGNNSLNGAMPPSTPPPLAYLGGR
ncbi:hypothetical protein BGZ99_005505 [Dissophora globulifera]|uniref:Uncharacterized protein n=1 Tax=Dissophora globulifera TaxID=979702 RepID=A0A9P6UTM8_9FUNG|nr:hypothetical protein BGZ99_005505 [Dissophora globulifera]